MSLRLSRLLDQAGISSVFQANGFTRTVAIDGTVFFSYRTFEFTFHVSQFDKNLIYCDHNVTYRYGMDIFPGWKRNLRPEELPELKKKLEDVYIPIIMKIQVEFPFDLPFEEIKAYIVPRFSRIGYQFLDEYSGNKILNIEDYSRPELNDEFTAVAFIKGRKVARVLIRKIDGQVFIDLLCYPEEPGKPRIVRLWHYCVSPFVSKYELLDGLVRWVSENEDKIGTCDDTGILK